jgi:hypothetical protein
MRKLTATEVLEITLDAVSVYRTAVADGAPESFAQALGLEAFKTQSILRAHADEKREPWEINDPE